jgi:hypothetical protein
VEINYTDYFYPDPCNDASCFYREAILLQPHYHYAAHFIDGGDGIMTAAIRGSVEVIQLEMWDARRQDTG